MTSVRTLILRGVLVVGGCALLISLIWVSILFQMARFRFFGDYVLWGLGLIGFGIVDPSSTTRALAGVACLVSPFLFVLMVAGAVAVLHRR